MLGLTNLLKSPIGWLQGIGEFHDYVLSSRIRLARNLTQFRYPHAANPKELKSILELTVEAARQTKELSKAAYLKLSDFDQVDLTFLVERHLISADLAGHPENRAAIVGDKELISLMINEEDHLRIQVVVPALALANALNMALTLGQNLSFHLPFAFHQEFGYLTSCPTNVGTGLRASCLIHLPGLAATNTIAQVFQELSRVGMVIRGFYGEGSNVYGELFQISNAATIGKNEAEFAGTIANILKNLIKHESAMRAKLFKGAEKHKTTDKIWRAYGLLSQCRLISYAETMRELSLLRLGLSAQMNLAHLDIENINKLIILTQPAHVQMQAGQPLNPTERDELRATLIRQALKKPS